MIAKIKAKENLYIQEWQTTIINDCDRDVVVDLGHTELMIKTITIKEEVDIPEAFKK